MGGPFFEKLPDCVLGVFGNLIVGAVRLRQERQRINMTHISIIPETSGKEQLGTDEVKIKIKLPSTVA